MRILHVDKFLRRSGGAAVYMLDMAAHQERLGHRVDFFSMQDDRNREATYEPWFPPPVSFDPPPVGRRERLVAGARMVYSLDAARGMAEVVRRFRPDVVHLHNIYHQLSPSILRPVARAGIPIVMTVHDYKLVCPTYRLLSHGSLCDACVGGRVWEATRRRCQGGSLTSSALLSLESGLHRALRAYGPVQRFIAPSRFLADQLRRGGVYPDRVRQLNNPIDTASVAVRAGAGDGFVSIGRLAPEKGVDTAIRAVGLVEGATLTVAGDGPERLALEDLAARVAPGRVTFTGQLDAPAVAALNRSARAAVAVARWHENMPLSALETMGAAVPLVVSGLGGLPELVTDGENGLVVPHDDPRALAAALQVLLDDPARAVSLGEAARRTMVRDFDLAGHLVRLFGLYDEAAAAVRAG
jgi:glycosyltransferase involved in cell wall biosynthesis